ncbi:MAG: DnaK suppressor protein [Arenicella sp.]|jgi:DnaK suppressor protein
MKSQLTATKITSLQEALTLERSRLEKSKDIDDSSELAEAEVGLALEDHIIDSLAQIDLALEKIEHGQYGLCIDCGKNIPIPRLEAFPAAARCLACKQIVETN